MSKEKLADIRGGKPRLLAASDLEITPQMLGAFEHGSRMP